MKNYKEEAITEKKLIHVSTTCNKCGKTKEPEQVDHYIWETFAYDFAIHFKEGSQYEEQKWMFDICEECAIEFVKTFKIVPQYFNGSTSSQSQKVFDEWKKTGQINNALYYNSMLSSIKKGL
ncbi:hypothetical protein [Paenibacillus lactis]|uniref:hypothetical protein n=1 Tax=Paenibacillus lactis TaxID=228574 RepID=UPI003D749992